MTKKANQLSARLLQIFLVASMLLSLLTGCGEATEEPTPDIVTNENSQLAENAELGETVTFGAKKKTEYTVVSASSDDVGRELVSEFSTLIYETYKISFTERSDEKTYEKEIVIGNANREFVSTIQTGMVNEDDFCVAVKDGNLYLYASSAPGLRRLMIALKQVILQADAFALQENYTYTYHKNYAEINRLSNDDCMTRKTSDHVIIINEDTSGGENSDIRRVAKFVKESLTSAGYGTFDILEDWEEVPAGKKQFIIALSGVDKAEAKAVSSMLYSGGDFLLTVGENGPILLANDLEHLVLGAFYFVNEIIGNAKESIELSQAEEYRYHLDGETFTVDDDVLYDFYINTMKRYPTLSEWYLRSGKAVSSDGLRDQNLLTALEKRMGNACVFCVGSSNCLYDGWVRKLDPSNYAKGCILNNGKVYIPSEFSNTYFNTTYEAGTFVGVEKLATRLGYEYYYNSDTGLVIISPDDVTSFADLSLNINGYTNATYQSRMVDLMVNSQFPEPQYNTTEQTRVVIDTQYNFPEKSTGYEQYYYNVCYSPSIATIYDSERKQNVIYASYELCTVNAGVGSEDNHITVIRRSYDGGTTWEEFARVKDAFWGEIFFMDDTLYLCAAYHGTTFFCFNQNGGIEKQVKLSDSYSGIVQELIADGYLYLPLDFGTFSVKLSDDIFNAENWSHTADPTEYSTKSLFYSITGQSTNNQGSMDCMEANTLKGKDGKIYIFYRVETQPYCNYAMVFRLSDDRTQLEPLDFNQSLLSLPTTVSRFTIKYDEVSGYYIMISNWYTEDHNGERARNVLGLSVSKDLFNWTEVDVLLTEREFTTSEYSVWCHAFQYTDWDFDGDDIVMDVREATGYTCTFHDGKYCTFYRLANFRQVIAKALK